MQGIPKFGQQLAIPLEPVSSGVVVLENVGEQSSGRVNFVPFQKNTLWVLACITGSVRNIRCRLKEHRLNPTHARDDRMPRKSIKRKYYHLTRSMHLTDLF